MPTSNRCSATCATGAPEPAPREVVDEAAEVVDPVTMTAEGNDAGAERGPAGVVCAPEGMVAITRRHCSEGVGEGEVAETGWDIRCWRSNACCAHQGDRSWAQDVPQLRRTPMGHWIVWHHQRCETRDGRVHYPWDALLLRSSAPTVCPRAPPLGSFWKIVAIGGRRVDPA